jgi:hypothetical protein
MKKAARLVVLAAVVLLVASCTTFKMSGIQQNETMPSYESVGEFETTVAVHEFLGASGGANLFNASATAMDNAIYDAIRREIQKYSGDAAVNVTVEYQATFIDMLLNGITSGIYAPAKAKISGVIVKYQ